MVNPIVYDKRWEVLLEVIFGNTNCRCSVVGRVPSGMKSEFNMSTSSFNRRIELGWYVRIPDASFAELLYG